jgi:hypothetical protein
VVPEAELEVIKRRCCCGGTEPGGISCPECPSPVAPCTTPRYSVRVVAGNIKADSAGLGCLAISSHVLDCMRGDCGRTTYRRKALTLSTLALGVCDTADICDAMIDQDGPYSAGDHGIVWEACPCNSFEPDPADACVLEYDQESAVVITWLAAQVYWNPATCFWAVTAPPGTAGDCRSYIEVQYTYTDSFQFPYFDDAGPPDPCSKTMQTFTVSRTWICYYSRRVAAGQFMAVGTYRLVRCEYPAAINTIGPTGGWNAGCGIAGGTVCSADGLTSVGKIPTLWQPPNSITVERLC